MLTLAAAPLPVVLEAVFLIDQYADGVFFSIGMNTLAGDLVPVVSPAIANDLLILTTNIKS